MAEIGSHPRRPHDIVEGELGDQWALLQEQGQGLADTTSRSQYSHLGGALGALKGR